MNKDIQEYVDRVQAEIISEHQTLDIVYKGNKYTFNVGDTIGRLTIKALVKYRDSVGCSRKGCISVCECGNIIGPSRVFQFISGDLVSCGCYSRDIHSKLLAERNTVHGDSCRGNRSRLYTVWSGMIQRCRNTDRVDSKYYSLKGITVCDEWKSFTNFKEWALANGYRDDLTIDRKDSSIGYNPNNCRFISMKEQQLNKDNARIITYNGISDSIAGWSRRIGVSWATLDTRLKYSKNVGEALGFE